ncbi:MULTISPECIES: SMC-Scp complex subunit ScpB [unclassified Thermosynechococcus]|uniref:SMC-Scp complex subunit ScpB n=1 Tax=unclassified Thermosynechococcus TaxID=2622553 RepID=UPI00197EC075|nr:MULTISPECIES: SMC-Scp complex subunit ScpB [unclassified Thermosynechococcus]QSF50209.1 SMC-Scp complex subunit ScpB [Thermosynechococcus sp. TA-1]WKT82269.1 SMC-Scp complex subunit ScpB [Thermosynechococcus sp. PP45]WNC25886.1 SMC-Scp complex subunit ScpB [Thermosynechococcus sp. PP551]WNC28466.1 SMC-Scp complex subunit ScpB [Thermosynechococcus sp. PP555]WNC33564.1 SMC-Scp complex subunit ScpB [Thermosynechococcus sp. PKX95]
MQRDTDLRTLTMRVEAILYLKAQPLTLSELATLAATAPEAVELALIELLNDYAHRQTALEIVQIDDRYSLQLKPAFQELVQSLVPVELGVAAQRTLALIAFRGPMRQAEVIELRGSSAYQHIQELLTLGFIQRRRDSQSRSYILQVTERFHQYFQVDQLPTIQGERADD